MLCHGELSTSLVSAPNNCGSVSVSVAAAVVEVRQCECEFGIVAVVSSVTAQRLMTSKELFANKILCGPSHADA
jgi:hypothetical protein